MAIEVYRRTPERDKILGVIPRRNHVTAQTRQEVAPQKRTRAASSTYTGMFKLGIEEKDGVYYLNVTWPENPKFGEFNEFTVGSIYGQSTKTLNFEWLEPYALDEKNAYIYLDPFAQKIIVDDGRTPIPPVYFRVGYYTVGNHNVTQLLETYDGLLPDTLGQYFKNLSMQVSTESVVINAGSVYVNNISYSIYEYKTSLPVNKKTFYYVRYTAKKTGSEEPDWNLTENEIEQLRTDIADLEVKLKEQESLISQQVSIISQNQNYINTSKRNIANTNDDYRRNLANRTATYNANINLVNQKINALDPEAEDYQNKLEILNQQLVSLAEQYENDIKTLQKDRDNKNNTENTLIITYTNKITQAQTELTTYRNNYTNYDIQRNQKCVELYGFVPEAAHIEIIESTKELSQTDQYLYYLIGTVSYTNNIYSVNQAHNGTVPYLYFLGYTCEGTHV